MIFHVPASKTFSADLGDENHRPGRNFSKHYFLEIIQGGLYRETRLDLVLNVGVFGKRVRSASGRE